MAKDLFDALAERRKVLLAKLQTDKVRGNPVAIEKIARELRRIAEKLDTAEK